MTPIRSMLRTMHTPKRVRNKQEQKSAELEETLREEGEAGAVAYCESEIEFYSGTYTFNHSRWKRWQTIIIVSGALGTLAPSISIPPHLKPLFLRDADLRWLRALPSAIATIAAAISGSFSYQSDAVRQGATSDSLQGELQKFRAKAAPYNEADRVSKFLNNIRTSLTLSRRAGAHRSAAGTRIPLPPKS